MLNISVDLIMPPQCVISKVKDEECKVTFTGGRWSTLQQVSVYFECFWEDNIRVAESEEDKFGVWWGSGLSSHPPESLGAFAHPP